MGLRKDLHIGEIIKMPEVRERWRELYGKYPDQGDVDNMFRDFVPMQLSCLREYTTLIPGTVKATNILRKEFGLKIGSSTGFLRSMVDVLLEDAKKQGFVQDASIAGWI